MVQSVQPSSGRLLQILHTGPEVLHLSEVHKYTFTCRSKNFNIFWVSEKTSQPACIIQISPADGYVG